MLNGFFKVLNRKLKVFYMQVLFIDSKFIASILEETTWPCQRTRSHSSPNEWNDSSSPFAETIFRNFCYSSHGCSKPTKSSNVSRLPFFCTVSQCLKITIDLFFKTSNSLQEILYIILYLRIENSIIGKSDFLAYVWKKEIGSPHFLDFYLQPDGKIELPFPSQIFEDAKKWKT